MTEQEFFDLARQGYNRIPLVREMPGDLETPLSVYLKLANAPYSYLLESVVTASASAAIPSSDCRRAA